MQIPFKRNRVRFLRIIISRIIPLVAIRISTDLGIIYSNSYYNRGYTEGVAKVDNGTVTYITHSHTESGCSLGQCNISANIVSSQVRSDGRTYYTYSITHSLCGSASTSYTTSNASYQPSPSSHSFYTCGYSDGEIIGAEITFN